MDHCHVIVKADTTWKEDWIFKKSGIDKHFYWFIFTTDTLYLVECTCPLSEQMIKRNKVLEMLSLLFIVCWKRCALYMSKHSCTCLGPSVWVFFFLILFSTCIFFNFVSVFTVLSLVTCLDRPMWLCCNLLTSKGFRGNTEKKKFPTF